MSRHSVWQTRLAQSGGILAYASLLSPTYCVVGKSNIRGMLVDGKEVMEVLKTRGGTGDYPSTWEGVYQLLEDIECGGIADDLKEAVTHAII